MSGQSVNAWYQIFKPSAPARVHMLTAALMWSVVGTGLLFVGLRWTWSGHMNYAVWLLPLALAGGMLKGKFVLVRAAGRMTERMKVRGDGRCLGGFVSLKTWALIGMMMAGGRLLRGSSLPRPILGLLYAAIGFALLVGSLRIWSIWSAHRRGELAG